MRSTTRLIADPSALTSIDPAMWDSSNTLVIAYCPSNWARAEPLLAALRRQLPLSKMVGVSTAGHFASTPDIHDETTTLHLIRFEHATLRACSALMQPESDAAAFGRSLGSLLADVRLSGLLAFTDGTHMDGAAFIEGIRTHVTDGVVMAGGMAGDGDRFGGTWLWDGEQQILCGALIVGVDGAAKMSCASASGWTSFGVDRVVTGTNGAVLTELDGQPALALYRKYLGERAADLPASALLFPLSVTSAHSSEPVVRTILAVNDTDGAMRLAGTVAMGSKARLMRANPNRLIEAAGDATMRAQTALGIAPGQTAPGNDHCDRAVLVVNCVGRRLVLRQRAEEEIEIALANVGASASVSGFYSYGEFGPSGLTTCALHNQTFTIAVFTEDEAVASST